MKKTITAALLFFISCTTYSQWSINVTFSPAQSLQVIRFINPNTGYCTAPVYGSQYNIHKTTNAGGNWIDQTAGYVGVRFMSIWCLSADTVFMTGNYAKIIRTVNGGQNWTTIPAPVDTTIQLWGIQFVNSLTGFICGSNGKILKSTDRGSTWFELSSGVQNAFSGLLFRNEQTGYICGSAIVLKTTNAGSSWINCNAPYFSGFETFRQIIFLDDNTGYYSSDAGRIVKTTNAGGNWTLLTTGVTDAMMGIYFINMNTGYSVGYNGRILVTTDAGATWTTQASGTTDILTSVWFTSSTTGYITTWYSKVLKTTNGGMVFVEPISNKVPNKFSLEQNYPNPFNPTTKIRFSLPRPSPANGGINSGGEMDVKLVIFDILGKKVASLIPPLGGGLEGLNPGTYEVTWNAANFPSGVYFYQLNAGNFSDTKRMILIK